MRGFINFLDAKEIGEKSGRAVWKLDSSLIFFIDSKRQAVVPSGFETDFGSVPRVPLAWWLWGDKAHRECVLHDYFYRKDAVIVHESGSLLNVTKEDADWYFRMAMKSENRAVQKKAQPYYIYQPMYLGVKWFGDSSFHQMNVMDRIVLDE